MAYERKSIISIEEVLPFIDLVSNKKTDNSHIFDNEKISMGSQRYQLFKQKGITCVTCGIIGRYFAIERTYVKNNPNGKYHLNLYALDENNKEVLMTKDHIVPKSKGGANNLKNYQTMCSICNETKGNKLEP